MAAQLKLIPGGPPPLTSYMPMSEVDPGGVPQCVLDAYALRLGQGPVAVGDVVVFPGPDRKSRMAVWVGSMRGSRILLRLDRIPWAVRPLWPEAMRKVEAVVESPASIVSAVQQ